ncbi:MAG TPA: VTT domain-containing protein, partial [Polyangia bacterium]
SVRNRLLGEHLGLTAQEVGARLAAHGSLLRLVDEQPPDAPRRLIVTPTTVDAPFDFAVLDGAMVDPAEPWNANFLLDRAVPMPLRRRLARRWLRPVGIALAVIAVWTLIRAWHPLAAGVHGLIAEAVQSASQQRGGSLLALLFYCLAGAVFVPVTLLATVTLAVFGMWPGVAIAWAGGVLSATLSHLLGGWFGPRLMRWMPEHIERSVRRFLRRQGFWSVIFIRLVPLGNFGMLNLVAGALRVPRKSFILGNMVGLLPGLLGLGMIVDRLRALLHDPSPTNVVLAGVVLLVVAGLVVLAKRRFRPEPESHP